MPNIRQLLHIVEAMVRSDALDVSLITITSSQHHLQSAYSSVWPRALRNFLEGGSCACLLWRAEKIKALFAAAAPFISGTENSEQACQTTIQMSRRVRSWTSAMYVSECSGLPFLN